MIAYLLFLHFIADFLLQNREMGRKKSEVPMFLLRHVMTQFAVFYLGLIYWGLDLAVTFAFANAFIHGIIDWNVWQLYKLSVLKRRRDEIKLIGQENFAKKWKYWEDHWFYVTIGFDQLLHGITIVGVWNWLS